MNIALLLLTLLLQPAPPNLIARWDSATSASIEFTISTRACLYRESAIGERVFVGCWESPGEYRVRLGGPGTDGVFRPAGGDVYVLRSGGQSYRAPLRARDVYLPVVRG